MEPETLPLFWGVGEEIQIPWVSKGKLRPKEGPVFTREESQSWDSLS